MIRRLLVKLGLLQELPSPVPYEHPRYGRFADDGTGIHNDVKVEWLGHKIAFSPDALYGVIIEESFATMDALLADAARWNGEWLKVVRRDCYPEWRENWYIEDEWPDLTEDQFCERLTIGGISTSENGSFTFYIDPDDLFGDHTIVAFGTLEGGIEEAYHDG